MGFFFQNSLQGQPYSIVGCLPFTFLLCCRLRTLPGMAAPIPVTHSLDLAGSLTPCPVSLTVSGASSGLRGLLRLFLQVEHQSFNVQMPDKAMRRQ